VHTLSAVAIIANTNWAGQDELCLQEMFVNLRRGLDNELDNIVTVLAKRSGEVCCCSRHCSPSPSPSPSPSRPSPSPSHPSPSPSRPSPSPLSSFTLPCFPSGPCAVPQPSFSDHCCSALVLQIEYCYSFFAFFPYHSVSNPLFFFTCYLQLHLSLLPYYTPQAMSLGPLHVQACLL
jgi:hypothetical protein